MADVLVVPSDTPPTSEDDSVCEIPVGLAALKIKIPKNNEVYQKNTANVLNEIMSKCKHLGQRMLSPCQPTKRYRNTWDILKKSRLNVFVFIKNLKMQPPTFAKV